DQRHVAAPGELLGGRGPGDDVTGEGALVGWWRRREDLAHRCLDELLLGRPAAVDRRLADLGARRDPIYRERPKPGLGELVERCREDLAVRLGAPGPAGLASGRLSGARPSPGL